MKETVKKVSGIPSTCDTNHGTLHKETDVIYSCFTCDKMFKITEMVDLNERPNKDRVEIFILDHKCMLCNNQTRVCFIVNDSPLKLCSSCASSLKRLINDP